jgi:hypothetical protein
LFIPLEGQGIVSLHRVIALVREENETAIFLRDGTVMATGFKPDTLAKRYRSFLKDASRKVKETKTGGELS